MATRGPGRGVWWVVAAGLVAAVGLLLGGCDELAGYLPPPEGQQPPPQHRPPVVVQPPVVGQPVQPPVFTPPPAPPPPPPPPPPPVVVQPPPVEPPPGEEGELPQVWVDTLDFNPAGVEAREIDGRWFVMAGDVTLLGFEEDAEGARRAVGVIRFYRMNQQCSIGRPVPLLQYYLVNGQPPNGPMPGETAVALDPARLDVAEVDNRWLLVQGNVWLLDFGPAEAEARAALAVIRNAGFTHLCFVGQPRASMLYFRSGGAGAAAAYVQASLAADTPGYSGPLPASLAFRGSITVGQPCDVQYTFIRSDGLASPTYALRFAQAGQAEVATEVAVAREGAGWVALRVLAPVLTQSAPAFYEVRPQAVPLVLASVLAQPPVYVGRPPATIRFLGRISVGQPCEVQYAFVRSNGTMGPVQSIQFDRRGAANVFDEWTHYHDYVGWSALRIVSPVDLTSEPAPFEVRIGGHRRIQASLSAEPSLYSGALPAPIDFHGMIAASHPCEVQYVFIRSDNTASPVQRLRFYRPGAQRVSTRWLVPWEGTGWVAIRVLAPERVESERALFEVRSPAQPHVHATLFAEPQVHPGPLPATVRFRGIIAAGQRCDVSYVFVRSDGFTSPVQHLRFFSPGRREVWDSWTLDHNYTGWAAIRILRPIIAESERAPFAVQSKVPPLTLRVGLAAEPPKYAGPSPATILLRGTISASRACDVQYVFHRSDSPPTQPRLLRFIRPGVQEVTLPWRITRDFVGWAMLEAISPVNAQSARVPVRVDIQLLPPRIKAVLAAEPRVHPGPLPATIRFRGTITVDRPCEVRYVFVGHDGATSPPRILRFNAPGSHEVSSSLVANQDTAGWQAIRILAPVAVESNQAQYEVKSGPPLSVEATLRAEPPAYKGLAPATIAFRGTIRVTRACDVRYAFVRSDGTQSTPQTLRFPKPGVQPVEETRQFASDAKGWVLLRILAPVAGESPRADYVVNILKKAKVDASLRVLPQNYSGPAPAVVRFLGTIKVDQPCDVRYAIAYSDGTSTAEQVVRFNAPGTQGVEDVRKFAASMKGWAMLRILAPVATEFDKANFNVEIREAPPLEVKASLRAERPKYSGPAPALVQFKGSIRVSQPCEVRYTFVRSDGVRVLPQTLRFDRPSSQNVEYELKTAQEGSGWVTLRVLAPVAAESEQADFEVRFVKPKPRINVDLSVAPPKYDGPAPANILFTGRIQVDQPCTVQCQFLRDSGHPTPPRTLQFVRAGEQEVTLPLRFTTSTRGWVQLRVLAPEAAESRRVNFAVNIEAAPKEKEKEKEKGKEKEPPPAASVEAILEAEPADYVGKLPVTIKFKGSIRVSAPCQLTYVFVRSDGTTSRPDTIRFNKADDKKVSDDWKVDRELAGWVAIRILAPVKAESNRAQFNVRRGAK